MLDASAANPVPQRRTQPASLPTRIITYAWGERYIDELLSLTLPAVLAPGNLRYVVSVCPCVFMIITQEIFFERIMNSPVVSRIRELCPVRLMALDDLVIAADKYGMTLTYALHRGFSDLGPSMTDHWLIFFNADFILADGSWRNLLAHFARGERLIASPSYCVRSGDVVSELRKRIDTRAGALVLEPRELASLVLRHRHDTVRAKTVNQRLCSARYMDQFYWLVDDNTLLGHQMPVSIVGMRPERYLKEPNSYWDYGFMRELCPEAEICVIGDSDEFLMMELRQKEVAADQISDRWPSLSEIGKRMKIWVTPYQRDFAQYSLTLHTEDLPREADEARRQLKAFVDDVLSHAPVDLPSHIDHPQWNYHWRGFMEVRHKYLSSRLGSATADEPPLDVLSELDKAWWKLDGLEKSYLRRRLEIAELMDQERDLVGRARARLEETTKHSGEKLLAKFLALEGGVNDPNTIPWAEIRSDRHKRSDVVAPWVTAISEYEHEQKIEQSRLLTRITEFINREEETRLRSLEIEFEAARRDLQNEYDRLMPKSIESAAPMEAGAGSPKSGEAVPQVLIQQGPLTRVAFASGPIARLARPLHIWLFGRVPRVRMLHPYWATLRHLVRLVDGATEHGARNVLMVGRGAADGIADHLPGMHAQLSLADTVGANLDKTFDQRPDFDLCICSLTIPESSSIPKIIRAVTPYMRVGGKIIIFLSNFELNHDLRNDPQLLRAFTELPTSTTVYFAGGLKSARILQRLHDLRSSHHLKRLLMFFLIIAPGAIAANKEEASSNAKGSVCSTSCTSITIEIEIGPPQSEAGMVRAEVLNSAG